MRLLSVLSFASFIVSATVMTGCAGDPSYATENGAIDGYDAVAYLTDGEAVQGSDDFTVEHRGATWKFASAENAELFENNLDVYLPSYSGWCAAAMADGLYWQIDPEVFIVEDGRVFLFKDEGARDVFTGDTSGSIERADTNWARLEAGR